MDIPLVSPRKLDQYVARYPGVWIVDVRSSMAAVREMIRQGYRALSVAGGITEYKGRNLVFSE